MSLLLRGFRRAITGCVVASTVCGCVVLPRDSSYAGPPPRPASIENYYSRDSSFGAHTEEVVRQSDEYTLKRLTIASSAGEIKIDYFQRHTPNDRLIFVFPILGGRNIVADYFASYFARRGFDSAVVQRVDDFKDPAKFEFMEELLRANVVRDRIAIDFFESKYGKKEFGALGVSRGAINVAMTAGVDPRLEHNVLVMGGTDIAALLSDTNESRILRYRKEVEDRTRMSTDEMLTFVRKNVKTDPKNLASYMDAGKTLMILALFDKTVPVQSGMELREQIGGPETIFLFSDHVTIAAYSRLVRIGSAETGYSIFPFDFIEAESLAFFNKAFVTGRDRPNKLDSFEVLRYPLDLLGEMIREIAD